MKTPASIAGHPIHPVLVTVPIGLWIFSFVCDLIFILGDGDLTWKTVALYCMAGGLVGAGLAAVPGIIDLISLHRGPAGRVALTHMALNLTVVGIYAVNLFFRVQSDQPTVGPVWASAIALVLLSISGWLGGRMVYELRVGVAEGEPAAIPERPERAARMFSRGSHAP